MSDRRSHEELQSLWCAPCADHSAVLLGNTGEASRGREECCLRHVEFEVRVKHAGRMDLCLGSDR